MQKLTDRQRAILAQLIYVEPFEVVLQETGMQAGELRDELINLINHGYVEVHNKHSVAGNIIRFYDSDNMHLCHFRITKSGLKQI